VGLHEREGGPGAVFGLDVEQGRDAIGRSVERITDGRTIFFEEAETRHPLVVEHLRQVAAAGVGDENDDQVIGVGFGGHDPGGSNGGATRSADQ